jgi:hypothetical protein
MELPNLKNLQSKDGFISLLFLGYIRASWEMEVVVLAAVAGSDEGQEHCRYDVMPLLPAYHPSSLTSLSMPDPLS